jgi:hypothetical protein
VSQLSIDSVGLEYYPTRGARRRGRDHCIRIPSAILLRLVVSCHTVALALVSTTEDSMRAVALFLIVALCGGCASRPPAGDRGYIRVMIGAPYDATWEQVVDLVRERGWPIADQAKAGGVINTEWMQVEDSSAYYDCGAARTDTDAEYMGRLNFVIRQRVHRIAGMDITVNTSWRAYPASDASRETFAECKTTGVLERHLLKEMQTRLEVAGVMPRRRWSW